MSLIHRYLDYFTKRPILSVVLLLSYFIAVVLPHEAFGWWIARNLDQPLGRTNYNLLIMAMGVVAFSAYLYLLWKGSQQLTHKQPLWIYLLITFLLILACINVIMVVNVEIIHFVQYTILAILLFPLLQNYQATLFFATIFGALDEAYQYLILTPDKYNYYDFNDVLIDMIGAIIGLLLLRSYGILDAKDERPYYKKPVFIGLISLISLVVFSYWQGWMTMYVDPENPSLFPLIKKGSASFWSVIPPSIKYHVVPPIEWIILTLGVWGIYRNMGKPIKKVKEGY